MKQDREYRRHIYECYASRFKGSSPTFDVAAADAWGAGYGHFLRGWLPQPTDAAIADVGCGAGRLLHFFKRHGYTHLAGVDISPEQVQLARQVVPGVVQGDVLEFLRSHENAFDLVCGLDIIEHLDKDEVIEFLLGCHKALKQRGRLVIQTPNAGSPAVSSVRYGDFTHEVCFTPESLGNLLGLAGFDCIEAREAGPFVHGPASLLRFCTWKALRLGLKLYNLAETGTTANVLTRVFFMSGCRHE